MKATFLGLILCTSFLSHAQEFQDVPDWARVVPEVHEEASSHNYNTKIEQLTAFLQPKLKTAAIEWFRAQFCTKSIQNIPKNTSHFNQTAFEIEINFLSFAFVFLMAGVDFTQVSEVTVRHMVNRFAQIQVESLVSMFINKNLQDGFIWKTTKNRIRTEIVTWLIKNAILPALKASMIEAARAAVIAQKEDEKRMAQIFKESTKSPKMLLKNKRKKNMCLLSDYY